MKAHIALFTLFASTTALALEPGHYAQRCDDAAILQAMKGADGVEKDGEPIGIQNFENWDIVVTKDGEWNKIAQTGETSASAVKGRMVAAPSFNYREKRTRQLNLETVTIENEAAKPNEKGVTSTSVYRVEEDGSRTLLRTIDQDGRATESRDTFSELTATDGRVVTVILSGGKTFTDPEGRRWVELASKHVCTAVPVKSSASR